jgi:hypothetical protein
LASAGALRARGFAGGSIYETSIDFSPGLDLKIAAYSSANAQLTLNASASWQTLATIEMSTDLQHWTPLQTSLIGSQALPLNVTNMPSPCAFYRLRKQQ